MGTAKVLSKIASERTVIQLVTTTSLLEGGGFPVRRSLPTAGLPLVDPFLLLDHIGPVNWPPNEAVGAPGHSHRGFETVTNLCWRGACSTRIPEGIREICGQVMCSG